jgi:hypothetical protein
VLTFYLPYVSVPLDRHLDAAEQRADVPRAPYFDFQYRTTLPAPSSPRPTTVTSSKTSNSRRSLAWLRTAKPALTSSSTPDASSNEVLDLPSPTRSEAKAG